MEKITNWPKHYEEKEIMAKFKALTPEKQIKILTKALNLALENRAGTKDYAIAFCMNYKYEDNGMYTYAK